MKKRIGSVYLASLILPILALAVLMLRVADPHSRWLAGALYAAGWGLLVVAIRQHARMRRHFSKGKVTLKEWFAAYRRHLGVAIGFAMLGAVMLVLVPVDAAVFIGDDLVQIERRVQQDRARVVRGSVGQARALGVVVSRVRAGVSTEAGAKADLSAAWASYLDYAVELDQLLEAHKYFYQINAIKHPGLNARSFLIGYAALVHQMKNGLSLSDTVGGNRNIETWLDEPNEALGVGADTYFHLRSGLTRADNLLRLQAGLAYGKLLEKLGVLFAEDEALLRSTRELAKSVIKALGEDPSRLVDNPLDVLEKAGFKAWLPLQKGIAVTISDIRTTRRSNFVGAKEIATLRAKLAPADILLERRNWYLTNLGLPGFWPHAAFYVGTPAELDAYFTGASREVIGGVAPSEYLAKRFVDVHAKLNGSDPQGDPLRVIEAVGEGVVLHSLEYSAHADYVAALRPRLSKRDKLASLLRAFENYGKPYDYDFDFVTDETLVCSELVFKALQPTPNKAGIEFRLVNTNGRLVLPPNDIARKYDQEAGNARRELDFVAYFEGSEKEQQAFEKTEADFRASWRKPKWDIAQP